jgi:tetratricopeptide (TPR) repeat protein
MTVVAVALFFSAAAVPAVAQMELGVIKGTVVDETGKPIDGAEIRLRNMERGRDVSVKTDKNGRFYRRGLQAVEYEMTVEKEGFQPIQDKVRIVAGTDRDFDFKLAKATPMGAEEFAQGVAAYNKGDFQAAATAFEAAVQKAPTIPDLYVNLALAYFRLERQTEAVANLEKAASLGPDDPKIHYQLGSAYVEMNEYDKAVAAFEKGLSANQNLGTDALALEATSTLGAVYFAQGDNDKAEAQFQKVHFSKGEVDKALQLFEQVASAHPGTPEATQAAAFVKELRKSQGPGGV